MTQPSNSLWVIAITLIILSYIKKVCWSCPSERWGKHWYLLISKSPLANNHLTLYCNWTGIVVVISHVPVTNCPRFLMSTLRRESKPLILVSQAPEITFSLSLVVQKSSTMLPAILFSITVDEFALCLPREWSHHFRKLIWARHAPASLQLQILIPHTLIASEVVCGFWQKTDTSTCSGSRWCFMDPCFRWSISWLRSRAKSCWHLCQPDPIS